MKILLRVLIILILTSYNLYGQDRVVISNGALISGDNVRFSGSHFEVAQNIPNPFSTFTEIGFYMPSPGFIEFKVVNLIGKEIIRQVMEADPGSNFIRLDGSDFMPGVYVFSISNGGQTLTRRMIISKK